MPNMIKKDLAHSDRIINDSPTTLNAILEKIMARDLFGMPVAFIACVLAAVVFGGLLAMMAGIH